LDQALQVALVDSERMRRLMPSIAIPLVVLLLYLFVPGLREQPWTALRVSGAALALIAYGLVTTARIQLGDSFTVRPRATELVTHGFYSRIRNPMYVFMDLMVLGLILAMRGYWFLVILGVLVILQTRQARREAKVLQEKFGPSYLEYRKQTWF
jgi:protein-S-isoprenylcysteine O-methyltransferase Ste14